MKWLKERLCSVQEERGHEKNTEIRVDTVVLALSIVFVLLILALYLRSEYAGNLNPRAEKLKEYALAEMDGKTICPGDIYDRNGTVIVENIPYIKKNGTYNGYRSLYSRGLPYTQIVGFDLPPTVQYSAIENDITINRRGYRLMDLLDSSKRFDGEDYDPNRDILCNTGNNESGKGQDVSLTIDNDLQCKVFDLMLSKLKSIYARGSAVVLDARTGEILSMVSFPTYNLSDMNEGIARLYSSDEELEAGYPMSHKGSVAPGSILKILSSVALIDHGMEDAVFEDTPFTVNEYECKNSYASQGMQMTYVEGLAHSSNVFFGKAVLELGKDKFQETADKFLLRGKNPGKSQYIDLDLGYIPYNWELKNGIVGLVQSAFGQGRIELTALQAAMMVDAIANDGQMMKPYIIKDVRDRNGNIVSETAPEVLSEVTSADTANKVTAAMQAAVQYDRDMGYGLNDPEDWRICTQYEVAGKTGTAQVDEKGNSTWFVSFAPASDPKYVVVVNRADAPEDECYGYDMIHTTMQIYKYLFEEKVND